ncbi:hypothetical protein [Streptomyces sp. NPDC058548]|uniref:hypothetical protein n=1 Tax=Streptomyces sp. NPDC058548 TaxID=3346545 RepID=UPI003668B6B8
MLFGDPRHRTEDIRAADPLGADGLLAAAVGDCGRVARLEPYDPGFATALDRVARPVRAMVFHTRHRGGVSAVSKLSAAVSWEGADRLPPPLTASAEALGRVLRLLKTFRARHLGIARKAYSEENRLYEEGSGGTPVALLRTILDLTRENETMVRRTTVRRRPAGAPVGPSAA